MRDLEREAAARVRVRLTARTPPERVVLRLGPTNSGKTHDAIEFLVAQAERGLSGTYAAPPRMLACEVYERLRARLPAERVGLVTGEERINPRADGSGVATPVTRPHSTIRSGGDPSGEGGPGLGGAGDV